ncbi:MAG: S8 family serine peptidase [Anaerolineae bacterium]|nr:S8 family serine peptidase [Anaerolineae bacterium]
MVAMVLVLLAAPGSPPGARGASVPALCPGSLLVGLREESRLEGWNLTPVRHLPALLAVQMAVPRGQEAAWMARLARDPRVAYVEPDYVAFAVGAPDDPLWPQQWGPQRIGADAAWGVAVGGAETVVALLDSGADLTHPDLAGQFWTNAGEISGNGLDDDGNGHADDVHGWHFYHDVLGGGPYEDAVVQDDAGHGTHVAGIVAALTANGQGVAGLARGTRLMLVRVIDPFPQACYSDVIAGLLYAVDNGARIINLSLGGAADSQALHDAVRYAAGRGALLVAASGNAGDGGTLYPARYEEVVAVNATDQGENPIGLWGPGDAIDLAAPGKAIRSTWLVGEDGYRSETGTSYAVPHVAGVAALAWSLRPVLAAPEVRALLEATADDVNAPQYPGRDAFIGWGRLNAARALRLTASELSLVAEVHPFSIPALTGTAGLTVTVTDRQGALAGSGGVISFTTEGVIAQPPFALTVGGVATTTLHAGAMGGMAVITASLGGLTHTVVTLTVEPPPRQVRYLPLAHKNKRATVARKSLPGCYLYGTRRSCPGL